MYASEWLKLSAERQKMENYFKFLDQNIRPGMKDLDKLFVIYKFILNWIAYGGKSNEYAYMKHNGVCADYSSALALALQYVGIQTIPIMVGYQANELHELVWVELDLENNGQNKWYACDPTFGDDGGNASIGSKSGGSSDTNWQLDSWSITTGKNLYANSKGINKQRLLFSIFGNNMYEPYADWKQQYNYNRLWYLIWTEPGKDNTNKYSKGNFNIYNHIFYSSEENKKAKYSNGVYVNGFWYYVTHSSTQGFRFKRTKLEYDYFNVEDVSDTLPKNIKDKLIKKVKSSNPLMFQINDCAFIVEPNEYSQTKKVLIVPINENGFNWDKSKEVELTGSNNRTVHDFSLNYNEDKIIYSTNPIWGSELQEIQLPKDVIDLFNLTSKSYLQKGDVEIWKNYYTLLINMLKVGDLKNQIKQSLKDETLSKFNEIYENSNKNNYYESIEKIKQFYENTIASVFVSDETLITSTIIPNVYYINKDYFDQKDSSGETFSFQLWNSPNELLNLTYAGYNYSIYYSSSKTASYDNFKLVVSNKNEPTLTKADLNKAHIYSNDYDGYYYIKATSQTNSKLEYKSKIFNIKFVPSNETKPNSLGKLSVRLNSAPRRDVITNYKEDNNNWFNEGFYLYTDVQYVTNELELVFINAKTKEIKVIETFSGSLQSQLKTTINDLTNNESGIYVIRTKDASNSNTLYSNPVFIFNKEDGNNFDSKLWLNAMNLLQ